MHLVMFVDAEPVDYLATLKEQVWKDVMVE